MQDVKKVTEQQELSEPRKLSELDLIDDFLFNKMMTSAEFSEEFGRDILKIIFKKDFKKLKVVAQKVYSGDGTDRHGARLDVLLEDDEDIFPEEIPGAKMLNTEEQQKLLPEIVPGVGNVFDIEPDKNAKRKLIAVLPRRSRFYHSAIDADCLKAGEDYDKLKRVIVIFIMPYDPFGFDLMRYTIRNGCMEVPELKYDDGAATIFLYTKGTKGIPSEELKDFLHYMEHTTRENASNDTLRKFQSMVDQVKQSREVSLEYMKIYEREKMLYEEGREAERENTERERQRAEEECRRAEEERQRADENARELEEERRRADENARELEEERRRAANEIAELKAEIARLRDGGGMSDAETAEDKA